MEEFADPFTCNRDRIGCFGKHSERLEPTAGQAFHWRADNGFCLHPCANCDHFGETDSTGPGLKSQPRLGVTLSFSSQNPKSRAFYACFSLKSGRKGLVEREESG